MDVAFLENLVGQISVFTDVSEYDPEIFPDISELLLYFLRIIPAAQLEPQLCSYCRVEDRFKLENQLHMAATSLFSNFEANCLIKHFLSVAHRLFSAELAHTCDGVFRFDLKTTRNILWAYEKRSITLLDVLSYCGILSQCLEQREYDYIRGAFRGFSLDEGFRNGVEQHFEILLLYFNTELHDDEEIGKFRSMIEQLFNLNAILNLSLDKDCSKEFDTYALKAVELFADVNVSCYDMLSQQEFEFCDVLQGVYPESEPDNLNDLKTYYKEYCYYADKLPKDIYLRYFNPVIEECFVQYQFSASVLSLLMEYFDEAVAICAGQGTKRLKMMFLPTCNKRTRECVEKYEFFQRIFAIKQKKVLKRHTFSLEGHIMFEHYEAERLMSEIRKQAETHEQNKFQFDVLTVQCLESGLFFAIQRVFNPFALKKTLILVKIMQAHYLKTMFGDVGFETQLTYENVLGLLDDSYLGENNLVEVVMLNSLPDRMRRLFALYILQLSYQNVLPEHQEKLLSLTAEDFVRLELPDMKIYLKSAAQLIFSSCPEFPILPYAPNIVEMCQFALESESLRLIFEEYPETVAAMIWGMGFYPGKATNLLEAHETSNGAKPFWSEILAAIKCDTAEMCGCSSEE